VDRGERDGPALDTTVVVSTDDGYRVSGVLR